MYLIIKKLKEKREYYKKIKIQAEEELKNLHEKGNIRIQNDRGKNAYFLCMVKGDTKGRYLKKQERDIARRIIQRDYNMKILKCADDWLEWIELVLTTMPVGTVPMIYEKSKKRKSLITPYELSDDEYLKQWESVKYQGKSFKAGDPEIYTEKDERVRSKTEKLIADKLNMLGIPYRYEYPLELKDSRMTIYPDFTILNLRERKEIIWEHFGMMDKPDYAEGAVRKIKSYTKNGYLAGENIIYTFETGNTLVDMYGIMRVLEQHGLVRSN